MRRGASNYKKIINCCNSKTSTCQTQTSSSSKSTSNKLQKPKSQSSFKGRIPQCPSMCARDSKCQNQMKVHWKEQLLTTGVLLPSSSRVLSDSILNNPRRRRSSRRVDNGALMVQVQIYPIQVKIYLYTRPTSKSRNRN